MTDSPETGGLPVAPGGDPGALVVTAGQLQFGEMLLGGGTSAGWKNLIGWRDAPGVQVSDTPRPQSHGSYPGTVLGDSVVVTYEFILTGSPAEKTLALNTLEEYAPLEGVDRPLTVNDGDGAWFRLARVTGRIVPQGKHFNHGPLECSLQFTCADPRRYRLASKSGTVTLPAASSGLVYPLDYPLAYGTSSSGSLVVTNTGSTPTPIVAEFHGPLPNPRLATDDWVMAFDLTLAGGETLTVDTAAGTALLDGTADRLYTLTTDSTPLELCLLDKGDTELTLTADSGSGTVGITYRDARM